MPGQGNTAASNADRYSICSGQLLSQLLLGYVLGVCVGHLREQQSRSTAPRAVSRTVQPLLVLARTVLLLFSNSVTVLCIRLSSASGVHGQVLHIALHTFASRLEEVCTGLQPLHTACALWMCSS